MKALLAENAGTTLGYEAAVCGGMGYACPMREGSSGCVLELSIRRGCFKIVVQGLRIYTRELKYVVVVLNSNLTSRAVESKGKHESGRSSTLLRRFTEVSLVHRKAVQVRVHEVFSS